MGVGFLWAAEGRVPQAEEQVGVRLRVGTPRWVDSRLGLRGTFLHTRGSLPERNPTAAPDADDPKAFTATRIIRTGGTLGGSWDLSSLSALLFDLRFEQLGGEVDARLLTLSLATSVTPARPRPALRREPRHARRRGGEGRGHSQLDELAIRAAAENGAARQRAARAGPRGCRWILFGDPPPYDRFYPGDINPS